MLRRLTLTAALLALAAPGVAAARETGIADLEARAAYALRAVGDAQGAIPVGDVDGDGHVDAGVLEEGGDLRIVAGGGAVRVVGGLDHDSDAFDDPRTAGDVDGDGFDDIALTGFPGTGAELEDDAPVVLAQVVLGGPRLRGERDARRPGRLGFAIRGRAPDLGSLFFLLPAPAGDVDGDGLDDLALGAPLAGLARGDARPGASDADTFARFPGAVFVVHGRRERTPVRLGGPGVQRIDGAGGIFGYAVAGPGDVDGDGLDDLAVGAPFARGAGGGLGRAYVVAGTRTRIGRASVATLGERLTTVDGAGSSAGVGVALAPAGDLDGDGRADLLAGAATSGDDEPGGVAWSSGRPASGCSAAAATARTSCAVARSGTASSASAAATRSPAAAGATACTAATATTSCAAGSAATSSTARPVATGCSVGSAATRSSAAPAGTGSGADAGATGSPVAAATTGSRPSTATVTTSTAARALTWPWSTAATACGGASG